MSARAALTGEIVASIGACAWGRKAARRRHACGAWGLTHLGADAAGIR
jgi:hypothetical protein